MDKPRKTLTGATFFGQGLWGMVGDKEVKLSRIVARHGPNTFETLNSVYDVIWLPGAEITIPEEWKL